MSIKTIVGIIPMAQSMSLLTGNVKESKKKKPNLTKMALKNIVGISLIKAESNIIASL